MSDLLRAEIDRLTERLAAVVAERDALVEALECIATGEHEDESAENARAALAKVGR